MNRPAESAGLPGGAGAAATTPATTTSTTRAGVGEFVTSRGWAIVFLLALILSAIGANYATGKLPSAGQCSESDYQLAIQAQEPVSSAKADQLSRTLEVVDPTQTQLALGRSPGPMLARIDLKTDPIQTLPAQNDRALRLTVDSFRRQGDSSVTQAVNAFATISSLQTVALDLCIEREHLGTKQPQIYPFHLDPGEYAGTITILDPRFPVTTINFTVRLAFPVWPWIALLLVLTAAAGSIYLMVLRRSDGETATGLQDLHKFLKEPSAIAAITAGSAAGIGVYVSTYLASDTWGSSSTQFSGLVFAMFSAFVAAGTAFRWATKLTSSPP